MSKQNRTPEEYIELYARDRNISTEEAETHDIVKETCESLKEK